VNDGVSENILEICNDGQPAPGHRRSAARARCHTALVAPISSAPQPPWRNLRFQALWIGMTSSTLGVAVADVAYPLVILTMTGSPARAGLFAAVQAISMLAAGLPAGSLADRFDPRTIVLASEACRLAATAAVVLALAVGWLSLPLLLAAGAPARRRPGDLRNRADAAAALSRGERPADPGLDLIVIVLLRHQSVPSTEIGLALGGGYAGGIAGIPVIEIPHRLRPG
jgi:MFS family permease